MIEFRWVWHDLSKGAPPIGSICVGDRLYQKLQSCTLFYPVLIASGDIVLAKKEEHELEWKDVLHSGLVV